LALQKLKTFLHSLAGIGLWVNRRNRQNRDEKDKINFCKQTFHQKVIYNIETKIESREIKL
jgi:hypothetical protein